MDKFEQAVKPGGLLIYDPNGITVHPSRKDITICTIDAAEESALLGNTKTYNMVVLGAFLKMKPVISMENIVLGLRKSLPERSHHLIGITVQAIETGINHVKIIYTV